MQSFFNYMGLLLVTFICTTSCAHNTTPLADSSPSFLQHYFDYGGKYDSTVKDLESERLSADIQRKIAKSDIQALKGGDTVLLVGNVASSVDIEVARSIVFTTYSNTDIIKKLTVDSPRSSKQLQIDNSIASKAYSIIEKQKLARVKSCSFNNDVYLIYPHQLPPEKLDVLKVALKKGNKNMNSIIDFAY